MKIISHRGFWTNTAEKNTEEAFLRALEGGFGIETDFRDLNGELVISHDCATGRPMSANYFFELVNKVHSESIIAVNIKADGLQELVLENLRKYKIKNYFVFDMSIPDTLGYMRNDISTFLRVSEYEEPSPNLLKRASGLWVDIFESDWVTVDVVEKYLISGKMVCLVSPELHKRNSHVEFWERFKGVDSENIAICTDYPSEAKSFFGA